MTMKLMHISLVGRNDNEIIEEFIPRIPTKAAYGEDVTHERICTSDTIIGCMKGHPSILNDSNADMSYSNFDPYDIMSKQSYLLDSGKSGFLCQLYHFEVPEDFVEKPSELKDLVPDVDFTNEHWIVHSVEPKSMQYVLIQEATCYRNPDNRDELVEKYEYTVFDTLEDVGEFVNCLDYHFVNEFIQKQFNLNCQPEIWGVKFNEEEKCLLLNEIHCKLSHNEAVIENDISNLTQQNVNLNLVTISADDINFF